MKLYRIILVDDEEEVRKSIIRKIKWEENGFLVAAAICNALLYGIK